MCCWLVISKPGITRHHAGQRKIKGFAFIDKLSKTFSFCHFVEVKLQKKLDNLLSLNEKPIRRV